MLLKSYRSRLILYSIVLMVFLSGTLIYSYRYVQNVIRSEADAHISRMSQLLNSQLETERFELKRYASIVADDLRLKEYMFVVAKVGSDSAPLAELYDRLFGWLPIDHRLILGEDGSIYVGKKYAGLANALSGKEDIASQEIFYFQGDSGLEIVAIRPIYYRDSLLGYVAVTRQMNQGWLDQHKVASGSHFFIVEDKKVVASTLVDHVGESFEPSQESLQIKEQNYRVAQIELPGETKGNIHLWFAQSETALNKRLQQHQNITFTLVLVGLSAIFILGLIIIRNFNRPLTQLTNLTRQVADGELPRLEKSRVKNEIDELANYFADMLQALRDKQDEVDRTQAKLEQIAITDQLTGLYNRRHLLEIFPKLYAQAQRDSIGVFAFLLDIDHFKEINDTYGHLAGDCCLESFSHQLQQITRKNDFLFRVGGEEFLVLTTGKSADDVVAIAEKIRVSIEQTEITFEDKVISMTTSCGVSCTSADGLPEEALSRILSLADGALYEAKNSGRNRVSFSKACKKPD